MNSPLSTTAWTTIPRCRTKYTRLTLRVPTIRAISFLGHFLCSKAKICDLCSEVSCLYIGNTKIINLPESSKEDSFFVLPVSLFGAARPGREVNPRCFSWIRTYEKQRDFLHFDFESTTRFRSGSRPLFHSGSRTHFRSPRSGSGCAVGQEALEKLENSRKTRKTRNSRSSRKTRSTSPPRNRAPLVGANIKGSATL